MFLCATFLVGSTPDEEEFRFAVLATSLQVRALLDGRVDFWTPLLGLGVPQPFVPAFTLHPLAPLLATISPATWGRLILVLHTLAGATGMWMLMRHLGGSPLARGAAAATFLLAAPTHNYALVQFWPSHYLVWTTSPWLLMAAWKTLESTGAALRRWSVGLGLISGLVLANTNPGHAAVYAVVAIAVIAARWRAAAARAGWLVVAAAIAAALLAPTLVQLAHERPYFAPDLGLANLRQPIPGFGVATVFLAPLGSSDEELRLSRLLFFGGPFAILAIVGAASFRRRYPELVLTLAVGLFLAFSAALPLPFISARYQFRDPVTLAAIPLAGLTLDRLLSHPRRRWLAGAVLVLQGLVLCVAIAPAARRAWVPDARSAEWFNGATAATDIADQLVRLVADSTGRLAYSPYVDQEMFDGRLHVEGLGTNALAYRGVPVVNGWFKAVSSASVSPDERMFYGRVQMPQQALESPGALDVLGIRYVLARPEDPVAEGLRERGVIPRKLGDHFVLYENTDVWDGVFLADPSIAGAAPPVFAECPHDRLLCRDVGQLAAYRLPDAVRHTADGGAQRVRVLPSDRPRVLVVTQMYRPDWIAASDQGRLETLSIAGALLGVRVPAGVSAITLTYRPWLVAAASALAVFTLLVCAALLILRGQADGASG